MKFSGFFFRVMVSGLHLEALNRILLWRVHVSMLVRVFCIDMQSSMVLMSYDIPFTGKHEPNKLTGSQLCDFVTQLVRALHRHRRGHGFEYRWVTWIFQAHRTIAQIVQQVRGSYLHLISNTALHITFLSYDIPFTGKHEPNNMTGSQLCDFVAQLVRTLHRHRRGHGFEYRWVTWIFQVHRTIA